MALSLAMVLDRDNLRAVAVAVAVTCFFAFAISIRLIKKLFVNKKRKKSCYLNTEPKPQNTFKRLLADNSYSQFKHLKLHTADSQSDEECTNLHPYRGEISKLMKNPNVGFLEFLYDNDYECGGLEMRGSYVWVESEAELRELVEVLSKEKGFAVDTEQHSFRSFLGFTALVQISTKREDYLVDAITLHDVMGLLRPVFADPGICKVFHGADNDVIWLQRDFHIYVVNLFDTAKACDILSKPQRSLAYLLGTYCRVATNKLLQREDWRQRPLSEEMIQYARIDAHYLLYIAHCLSLELKLQKNVYSSALHTANILKKISASENSSPGDKFHFLLEASRRSNATCLQLFAKDVEAYPGEFAASSIISRCLNDQGNISPNLCDSKFQEIVRRLCTWRDIMARLHDESLRFVLSENAIIALAAKIPTTEIEICSIISKADLDCEFTTLVSLQSPFPVVCCHLEDLLCLLRETITELDHKFQQFVQQHLGPGGDCPLSAYNYALLSKTGPNQSYRFTSNHNFKIPKQVAKKASRDLFVQKFSCKSPVYHNCKIYANDGRLLCYCDRKKLEWYLNRNLAKLVDTDPPSIMLLFEPKGRPEDEDNDFYIQSKKNICVGCGEGNHYLRYRIIPSCYRMHFPEHLKSHRSHDIVLVCVDCHEIAHAAAEKYKKQIAAEFGIPLFVRKVVDIDETPNIPASSLPTEISKEAGVSPLQLRTAAMALLRHGPQMPFQRREELMQIIMKYYARTELSDKDLERALMVGMSPHERRKLGKKKGFTFKHLAKCVNLNDEDKNNVGVKATVSFHNVSSGEDSGSLDTNTRDTSEKQDDVDVLRVENTEVIIRPRIGDNSATFPADSSDTTLDAKKVPGIICTSVSSYNDKYESDSISKKETSTRHVRDNFLKHEKLSLLGHGPHGKQVVEYLLKEHGVDGVHQFCQRWRQVFVEALHPQFLPAGWDVMHSGKRDFGEFSVYNPVKKVTATASVD